MLEIERENNRSRFGGLVFEEAMDLSPDRLRDDDDDDDNDDNDNDDNDDDDDDEDDDFLDRCWESPSLRSSGY